MDKALWEAIRQTGARGRLFEERRFCQHGTTSVYAHSVRVAAVSLYLARRLRLRFDEAALLRGALLHDCFLYDWHDRDNGHLLYGFSHPRTALENARRDYDLSEAECDVILHHMFPLVPMPPRCREAWIVCMADKYCALAETLAPLGKLARRLVPLWQQR